MDGENKKIEPITWQAPEYFYYAKTNDWFWGVGLITAVAVIASFWFGNFLLAVICGLAGFSIVVYGSKRPGTITFKLSEKGLQTGDKIYRFSDIKAFNIKDDLPEACCLVVSLKTGFVGNAVILLDGADAGKIKEFLLNFVREDDDLQEPFSHVVGRLIKF